MLERDEVLKNLLPTDDAIWRGRHRSWEVWQMVTGLSPVYLRPHFRRRGFRRGRAEGACVTEAPCGGCGRRFRARELSSVRLCDRCGEGTLETTARQELRRYRERITPERQKELRRIYTPGASGTNHQKWAAA